MMRPRSPVITPVSLCLPQVRRDKFSPQGRFYIYKIP